MPLSVRTVEYFYVRTQGSPENAYQLLAQLASEAVNLLAFSAVPYGPNHVELTIFPERPENFVRIAQGLGWTVTGPQHACLVQGDDRLGAVLEIHQVLLGAGVNVYASSGVTDGGGHFGYVIYFKEEDHQRAASALGAVTLPGASTHLSQP